MSEAFSDDRRETLLEHALSQIHDLPTPERDDEGKRRRLSSDLGADAACSSGTVACETSADSASSSDTQLQACDPQLQSSGVEQVLRSYLVSWGERLVQLQPKVHMSEHLIECGLYLFKYLRQLQVEAAFENKFPMQYLYNEKLLIHDLAACFWVSLKHTSVRTAVPNRTLMVRATGAIPELLNDRELATLIAIDWEVQAVLKKSGLVV